MIANALTYTLPNTIFITDSNLPKNDHDEYSTTKTYNQGDWVSLGDKSYYCTKDNCTDKQPDKYTDFWKGKNSNRTAMFEYKNAVRTEKENLIQTTFTCEEIDTIALFGLDAYSVSINVKDALSSTVLLNKTFDLIDEHINDFTDYLFAPRFYKDELIISILTTFDVEVSLSIEKQNSLACCSYVVAGTERELGFAKLEGNRDSFLSYVKQERDDWGNMELKDGNIYDNQTIQLLVDNYLRAGVKKQLKNLKGKPALFRIPGYELIFGVSFDEEIEKGRDTTEISMRLESII